METYYSATNLSNKEQPGVQQLFSSGEGVISSRKCFQIVSLFCVSRRRVQL